MSHCSGPCRQGRALCPTPDACLIAKPRERMGRLALWERGLLHHPAAIAVGAALCFALIVWISKP